MGELFDKSAPTESYLCDDRFVSQKEIQSFVTTTHLIIRDLYELFNYVEPSDDNLGIYSHRIYELFLRTSTEFESNCKAILHANGYSKPIDNMNIRDFFKIAPVARLYEYRVVFDRWNSDYEFIPFMDWNTDCYTPLSWYKSYNEVKHNRYDKFQNANLYNLMNAVAGLLCILHVQCGSNMDSACFEGISCYQHDQRRVSTGSFSINAPSFPLEEQYEFIWETLKYDSNPIRVFTF